MDGVFAGNLDRNVAEGAPALLRQGRSTSTAAAAPVDPEKKLESVEASTRVSEPNKSGTSESRKKDQETPVTREELQALTDGLNRVFSDRRGIRFDLSEDGQELVVQVVDLTSDEVVRTIPPDHLAQLHKQLGEIGDASAGLLLDDRA